MKIVVIGGTGLIGSKVVSLLAEHGHEAVAASPNSGVDTLTGEGVAEALAGADVVVDVSNSPSFADDDVMAFFTTSTRTLLDAERAAGVGHHVALSIVGADLLPDSGYLRAKVAQERLIAESGQPYTVVRSTQFFEFAGRIADGATVDGVVHVSTGSMQPIAAADASAAVARAAASVPRNGILEIGGPEKLPMAEFIRRGLAAHGDEREVVASPDSPYFGTLLAGDELTPGPDAELSTTSFEDWAAVQAG
ncbi:LysR family transcriptional regulator [Agromyces luteolus]|uniref:NAD(P)H-binding protein n=1 Tax=Agromyces luteolus TaxID=88373 RepID=A0A7C9HS51_9MICO|nr:SDR family oxidoreductase [Agromyces luteolus]MUN08109.1 NAD(P)H-binding protein [Agromyces luteolus]GLK27875.1 LysR family transcriptional regulator [Agromyces luteolus]